MFVCRGANDARSTSLRLEFRRVCEFCLSATLRGGLSRSSKLLHPLSFFPLFVYRTATSFIAAHPRHVSLYPPVAVQPSC